MSSDPAPLRILVVDNNSDFRELRPQLLRLWGYQPFVAEGQGETLLENARIIARRERCHLALVDVRLLDDTDPRDRSGLLLAQDLQPTISIIVTGAGDRSTAVAALKTGGVTDFIGKEDPPEQLKQAIENAAKQYILGPQHRAHIIWMSEFSSRRIQELLFSTIENVPDDEADELIGRLFPNVQRVVLTPLNKEADQPVNTPRLPRSSFVFLARIDDQPHLRVVKLGRTSKIMRETINYRDFVQFSLASNRRLTLDAQALLWDIGAIEYSYPGSWYFGFGDTSFTQYYRQHASADQILQPLRDFFSINWGHYYRNNVQILTTSLFNAYDAIWNQTISRACAAWANHEHLRYFPGLSQPLPNPTYWLAKNAGESEMVRGARQAVTHGDLHGDNLFVDDREAWAIDFERTGPGPILRDFAMLTVDVLTRLARFEEQELNLLYDLAVALCAPQRPDMLFQIPASAKQNPEVQKAAGVVQGLMRLAAELTDYADQREFLWGVLLSSMLLVTVLPEESPRRQYVLLLASVICGRLQRWTQRQWPPRTWPQIAGSNPATAESYDDLLREITVATDGRLIPGEHLDKDVSLGLSRPIEVYLSQLDQSLRLVQVPGGSTVLEELFSEPDLAPEGDIHAIAALDYLRDQRAVVLLGAPGSGKTVLLRYVARQFARARLDISKGVPLPPRLAWPGPLALPLYLQLRDLDQARLPVGDDQLLDLLVARLAAWASEESSSLRRYLTGLLAQGTALLLLDGLDEIAGTDRRVAIAGAITAFQQRFPNSRIIVTSRIITYREPALLPHPFKHAVLQDLRPEQQDILLRRWVAAISEPSRAIQNEAIALALFQHIPELRALTSSPWLLITMGRVFYQTSTVPRKRVLLYDNLLTEMLRPLMAATNQLGFNRNQWLRLFQELAYQYQSQGRVVMMQDDLQRLITTQLPLDPNTRTSDVPFLVLRALQEYVSILVARGPDGPYQFAHRILQEYLAARALLDRDNTEVQRLVLAFRHQPDWHETLLLVFEQLLVGSQIQRINELVAALLDDELGSEQLLSATLLGRIVSTLQETPDTLEPGLYERITRRLTTLVQSGRLAFRDCLAMVDTIKQIQPHIADEQLLAHALSAGAALTDSEPDRQVLAALDPDDLLRVLYAFLEYPETPGDTGQREQIQTLLCAALPEPLHQPIRQALQVRAFLAAAGFSVRQRSADSLLATSDATLWRDCSPLYIRLVLDRTLDLNEFLALRHMAAQLYQGRLNGKVAAAVIDRAPSGGDLLQIYALQAQDHFTVVPLELAQIRAAQGRERRELRDQIETYISRDDLYSIKKPVTSVLSFFGRNPLLTGLKNRLHAGRSMMIVGVRRVGKTSLISRLREDSHWPVAQLDLTARDGLESILAEAIERWRDALKLPALDGQQHSADFRRAALDLLAHMPEEQGLVLVLDEMDALLEHKTYLDFAATLKSTAQDALCRARFAIVMAGLDLTLNRSDRLGSGHNPFYEFFEIERLGMLSPDDTRQMIGQIGGLMGIEYAPEALALLADAGGGHPFLTRELCHAAVQRLRRFRATEQLITAQQAHFAINNYLRDTGNYLRQSLWEYATPAERMVLQLLATRGPLGEAELFATELSVDEYEQRAVAVERLRDQSLLADGEHGWDITLPLYRRWITSRLVRGGENRMVDG